MTAKLDLRDVDLVAIDTQNAGLTTRAMKHCMNLCNFADAVLVTNMPVDADVPFRTEKITPFATKLGYYEFVCKNIGNYTKASFVLIMQWDGYILDPSMWRKEYLDYDYIGAKWAWHKDGMTVGNGGFCLRSRKLLDILKRDEIPPPGDRWEDDYISRAIRPRLEKEYGIKFAPESIADLFSYERTAPSKPTFGFHGLFNMWRHVEDDVMIEIAGQMAEYLIMSREFAEITAQYFALRKFKPLKAFYQRIRKGRSADDIFKHFMAIFGNEVFVRECIASCEAVYVP